MFPFRRIFVADLSASLDLDLLRYGASIAAMGRDTEVIVGALPGDRVLRSLVPAVRTIFAERQEVGVSCRVLVDPEIDGLFTVMADCGADLLLVRHPGRWPNGRVIARRMMSESPCSVWFVPEGVTPRLRRVAVEVGSAGASAHILRLACALGRQAGAEFLVAIHVSVASALERLEELRAQKLLELQCMMARLDSGDMECLVHLDESPYISRTLRRAARWQQADLLVASSRTHEPLDWLRGRSEMDELVDLGSSALLGIRVPGPPPNWWDVLGRIFSAPEPSFN